MEENKSLQTELKTKHLGQQLVDELTAPTPGDKVKLRKGRGGKEYPYCEGTYFIEKMNDCFGFLWGFTCSEGQIFEAGENRRQIVVKGEVEVVFPGRSVETKFSDGRIEIVRYDTIRIKKSQFGGSDVKVYSESTSNYKKGDPMDIADDFKAAGTDAMKKAATQFGIALDVYGKREEGDNGGKKISSGQLETFYWRAGRAGMLKEAADEWAKKQDEAKGKSIENCDGDTLMSLIPKLMKIAQEKENA